MSETKTSPEVQRFSFGYAVFKPEVLATYDDEKLMRRSLGWLQNQGLYRKDLLYAGFSGVRVYKNGGFGGRTDTFAVTEAEWRRELAEGSDVPGNHNPFNHALHHGSRLVALGVFDPEKLVTLDEHPDFATALNQGRGHDVIGLPDNLDPQAHYVTLGGASLDTAAVAVLFFKNNTL